MAETMISTTAEAVEGAILQRRIEVSPETGESTETPVPEALRGKPRSPAQWAYERIILYLQSFEEMLDADHEAAIGLAGSESGVVRIEGLGYFEPDIITFHGVDDSGAKTQLIQHVTGLNVMLKAVPRARDHDTPRRIGFRLVEKLEEENSS